ncbi:hypothetical protein QBC43DRAFT_95674 [Cladorrhinum sp. PSN259]|nr:hypothetical protein QBC43DRAFT_95674 [Cladorrhinum sp. PSN259]
MSSLIVIRRRSCIGHDGSPETTSRVSYTPENLHKSAPSELPVSASQEKGPMSSFNDVSDLAERRRIQNRIAQRKYRKKLKKRLEQLDEDCTP